MTTVLAGISHPRGPIVCDVSTGAARVAAALSRHAGRRLVAVDALGPVPVPLIAGMPVPVPEDFTRERLERIAGAIPADMVEARAVHSLRGAALADAARSTGASLIVIDPIGARSHVFRSLPVRVANRASVPVLAVREAASVTRWVEGDDVLRVIVAIDRGPSASSLLDWCAAFTSDLPSEIAAIGLAPPMKPKNWNPAKALLETAADWHADVLVVGAGSGSRTPRFWQRCEADRLVEEAAVNVAVVPSQLDCIQFIA